MRELDECLKARREIEKATERLVTICAAIRSPKNQIITGMPRGGGETVNAIEKYIEQQEKLKQELAYSKNYLNEQWREFMTIAVAKGLFHEDIELMYKHFYVGKPWKKCTYEMRHAHGKHWNENRTFRTYRKVLSKCTEKPA